MKTALLLPLVAALLATLGASVLFNTRDTQPPALNDFCHSAGLPYGEITVNVDIVENDFPTLPGEASVFYSSDGQNSWNELPLAEMPGTPGGTWTATFPVDGALVFYYFMAHDDSAAAFGSPRNATDLFPPSWNRLAAPADEPAGDADAPDNNCVDLDGMGIGYSDDYFYATLSNVTGSWPTSNGFFGPWFIYSAVLGNPDASQGGVAFSLVYAEVPLLLSTGLYALDSADTSFTRIGDIDHAIQGGDLHLRCSLADLYAHPGFGPDNPSGYYLLSGGTATAQLDGTGFVNDATNLYAFYHRTEVGALGVNTDPVLSHPGYSLITRGDREAPVNFFVTYTDADGHLPVARNLVVDGVPHEMLAAPDHDYSAGVRFDAEILLPGPSHEYYFSFNDGLASVETPPETIQLTTAVPDLARGLALQPNFPNPFNPRTSISFTVDRNRRVRITVHSMSGQQVAVLADRVYEPGSHAVPWSGEDSSGRAVSSGAYLVWLESEGERQSQKVMLVR